MTVQTTERTAALGISETGYYTLTFPVAIASDLSVYWQMADGSRESVGAFATKRVGAETELYINEVAPPSAAALVAFRNTQPLQPVSFIENERFPATAAEQTLDRGMMAVADAIANTPQMTELPIPHWDFKGLPVTGVGFSTDSSAAMTNASFSVINAEVVAQADRAAAAAESARLQFSNAQHQVTLANLEVEKAKQEVLLAKQEVEKAKQEVLLAKQEVAKAKQEVQLAHEWATHTPDEIVDDPNNLDEYSAKHYAMVAKANADAQGEAHRGTVLHFFDASYAETVYKVGSSMIVGYTGYGYNVGDTIAFVVNQSENVLYPAWGIVTSVGSNGELLGLTLSSFGIYLNQNTSIQQELQTSSEHGNGATIRFYFETATATTLNDISDPLPNQTATVLRNERVGNNVWEAIYADRNGDGTYNWIENVPLTITDASIPDDETTITSASGIRSISNVFQQRVTNALTVANTASNAVNALDERITENEARIQDIADDPRWPMAIGPMEQERLMVLPANDQQAIPLEHPVYAGMSGNQAFHLMPATVLSEEAEPEEILAPLPTGHIRLITGTSEDVPTDNVFVMSHATGPRVLLCPDSQAEYTAIAPAAGYLLPYFRYDGPASFTLYRGTEAIWPMTVMYNSEAPAGCGFPIPCLAGDGIPMTGSSLKGVFFYPLI